MATNLDAQLMIAEETTWGTGVTPTRGFEFTGDGLKTNPNYIKSAGLRAGSRVRRSPRVVLGKKSISGDVEMEVMDRSQGIWWKHALGGVATSQPDVGASPTVYLHTFTPGAMPTGGLTCQFGRPDVAGTVQPFTYAGCSVSSWELACQVDQIAMLKLSMVGRSETTATALAAASYAAGSNMMTFVQGTLEVNNTAVDVMSASVTGSNGLAEDRYFLGSAFRKKPIEMAMREFGGKLEGEFEGLTLYELFTAKTEASLELLFTGGIIEDALPYSLKVTANVIFTGETPNVSGGELTKLNLPYEVVDNGTTSIKVELQTSDATP